MADGSEGRIRRRLVQAKERILSLSGTPRSIALGLAFGIAVSVWPLPGTHTALVVILCGLFRANLPAAYFSSWVGNPVTMPVFALVNYEIGRLAVYPFYGTARIPGLSELTWAFLKANVLTVLIPVLVGSVLVSFAVGALTYFASHGLIVRARRRNET